MIIFLIIISIIVLVIIHHYRRVSRLPPGPFSLPLIGNLHQLVYYSRRENGVVPMLTMYRKIYGNVFTLWFGPLPHVSVCDYETAHEVFVKNGSRHADRFLSPIFDETRKGLGLVFANGEIWQEMRRFSLTTFRNMGFGKDIMEERIMTELNARFAYVDSKAVDGVTVIASNDFFDITVGSLVNSILVGERFDEHNSHKFTKLKNMMDEGAESFAPLDLIAPTWLLKIISPKHYKMNMEANETIKNFVGEGAEKRMNDFKAGKRVIDPENPQDFVDAFLVKAELENKHGENPAYSLESLKNTLLDFWLAGHDTTSTTLISGANQLINNPDVIKKLRDELYKITNNASRALTLQDRSSTPYLNATIAEIQRHASVLTINFWRLNHELIYVNGHPVDAGALITAQLGALHVNDEMFKNSSKFDPSRYIENEKLINQVIPFGVGKRSCIGESLARAELYLILGNLLLRYDLRAHGKPPSVEDQLPFSAGKQPERTKIEFVKL